ncbi:hypothetical protein [Litorimonas sp.]|uniref:hypothetical protein n=1 Tax=Litorimonas sp. TaxID=1892381 RepID=UPI003A8AC0E8
MLRFRLKSTALKRDTSESYNLYEETTDTLVPKPEEEFYRLSAQLNLQLHLLMNTLLLYEKIIKSDTSN